MTKFTIPKTHPLLRVIDYLMVPIMFILGGFKLDSIQETHPWHSWREFSQHDIQPKGTVTIKGTDIESFAKHYLFLFHAPLFGGWRNYSVYSPERDGGPFYIGWIVYESGQLKEKGIHRLLVKDAAIKMLDGPPSYTVTYFAINQDGVQIPLSKIGTGRLGEGRHAGVRLF